VDDGDGFDAGDGRVHLCLRLDLFLGELRVGEPIHQEVGEHRAYDEAHCAREHAGCRGLYAHAHEEPAEGRREHHEEDESYQQASAYDHDDVSQLVFACRRLVHFYSYDDGGRECELYSMEVCLLSMYEIKKSLS